VRYELRNGVCVVHRPTREEFEREFLLPGRPAIVTGVVGEWCLSQAWSVDALRAEMSGKRLPVFTPERRFEVDAEELFATLERDDVDAYPYLVGSTARPMGSAGLPVDIGDEIPSLFSREDLLNRLFYFGRRTYTPLHYHPSVEAASAQILGDKRFLLFSPDQFRLLYAKPFDDPDFLDSRIIDPDNVDVAAFPRFARSRGLDVVVRQGEAIFIPIHWWHAVWGTERIGASITFFWRARFRPMIWPPAGRVHHWRSMLRWRRQHLLWDVRDWLKGGGPRLETAR
jgi:hypothetical protein